MNKEFNIGDKVWWAKYEIEKVLEECPVCFGKKFITVILGNETHIKTICDYCKRGISEPYGCVEVYKYVPKVNQIIIDGKTVNENSNGIEIKYSYGCYVLYEDDIFETKEEADKKVIELMEKQKKEEFERIEYSKGVNHKSYSWKVGYHLREAKKSLADYERHSARAVILKSKIKQNKIRSEK